MAIVTSIQVRACYEAALSVRAAATRRSDAVRNVANDTGMNESNAAVIVDNVRRMLDAKAYSFPLSTDQTRQILNWIAEDFGSDIGMTAAEAVLTHIKQTEGAPLNNGPQLAVREVAEQFLASQGRATLSAQFSEELAALATALARSPADRAARLAAADPVPRIATVTAQVFLRNPDVVAAVLFRAAGTCEGCGASAPFSKRSDDTPYLEVHHKHRLADGGPDTVANAIALCPNCHREAHFGRDGHRFREISR